MIGVNKARIYYGGFAFRGGGAYMHAKLMRAELQRSGWHVDLITLESLPLVLRFLPHCVGWLINFFSPPMGYYYKGRLTRLFYRLLFNRDANIRIFEDIYLAWDSRIPSVTLLHAVWSDNLQSIDISNDRVNLLIKAEEKLIDFITHPIITVSDSYKDFLEKSHVGSSRIPRISVIPLGLDIAEFEKGDELLKPAKSLVFCGSLEARKNLSFLLTVFKTLHDSDGRYSLTIIGDGPDRPDLERYAVQHDLPVSFCGRLGRRDVIRELRRHTLYVHPSVKESFSFALLEAKLTGLKTVAYSGLEVPVEFIDVPVASFDEAEWFRAISCAEVTATQEVDFHAYSSRMMVQKTLRLAFGATEVTL
ncbi:glycosyltransferase family 4 protein [Marinobacter goseongensis]|uniref:glycosyltransferase family 4 protein n=1 Tax=Marinobacter goseongensis TaxID=453838 RepID=UPI0020035F3B|nr:glycosyltransferase family 4 protein [Marinobacter goseongensis]MCK7551565.1 glycosyltransferase family 4 protein [Marinobacter goseongensis]